MFNSEFIERIQCRNEFQFNAEMEGCSEEDFITFLAREIIKIKLNI